MSKKMTQKRTDKHNTQTCRHRHLLLSENWSLATWPRDTENIHMNFGLFGAFCSWFKSTQGTDRQTEKQTDRQL